MFMDDQKLPVSLQRLYTIVKESTKKSSQHEKLLSSSQIGEQTEKAILNCPHKKVSLKFIESLRKFLGNIATQVSTLEHNDATFRRNFNHFTQS